MTNLTQEELQMLINVVSNISVPVKDADQFKLLINKLSKMIDELKTPPQPLDKK